MIWKSLGHLDDVMKLDPGGIVHEIGSIQSTKLG